MVPSGKVFILTDVDYQFNSTAGAADAGKKVALRIRLLNRITGLSGFVFEPATILSSVGQGISNESDTSGVPVGSDAIICFDIVGPPGIFEIIYLRGYLIDKK